MWRNCKGSFVLDLAISLVILSIFISVSYPLLNHYLLQVKDRHIDMVMQTILYKESLNTYLGGEINYSVEKNGKLFQVDALDDYLCVHYEEKQFCLYKEK